MAERMIFSYDKEGDILDISVGLPQKALSREISDDFFVRVDEKGKIVGFMVLNFEKRCSNKAEEKIPIEAQFFLSPEAIIA